MAKNTPAFQFYPSDFLGGVTHLEDHEIGVYIKLLCALWINGNSLSFRFTKLARTTSTPLNVFESVWPEIACKFVIVDGFISHPRFSRMMKISEINKQNGSLGGRPVKANGKRNHNRIDNPSESDLETEREAKTLKNEDRRMKNEDRRMKVETKKKEQPDLSLVDPKLSDVVADWISYKAERGESYKPIGLKAFVSRLNSIASSEGHEAVRSKLQRAMANDWKGWEHGGEESNGKPREVMTFAQQRELNMSRAAEKMKSDKMAKLFPGLTDER